MTAVKQPTDAYENRLPTKSEIAAAKLVLTTRGRLGRSVPEWINRVAEGKTPLP